MKNTNDLVAKAAARFGAVVHTLVTRTEDLSDGQLKMIQHDWRCAKEYMEVAINDAKKPE